MKNTKLIKSWKLIGGLTTSLLLASSLSSCLISNTTSLKQKNNIPCSNQIFSDTSLNKKTVNDDYLQVSASILFNDASLTELVECYITEIATSEYNLTIQGSETPIVAKDKNLTMVDEFTIGSNKYHVVGIGYSAFSGDYNHDIRCQRLTLPSSLTNISAHAFEECSELYNFDLSNCGSLGSISNYAFACCSNLSNIDLSKCTSLYEICTYAFYRDYNLKNLVFPNSLTNIGSSAFQYCTSLTSVTFPDSLTTISDSAFEYCSNLTSVSFPNSLATIGDNAFDGCPLTSISTPGYTVGQASWDWGNDGQGNAVFRTHAYWKDGQLVGQFIDKISSQYKVVGKLAYGEIDMSNDNLTDLPYMAFCDCENLTKVSLPNNLQYIRSYAFTSCYKIQSISFPATLIEISQSAFYNCSSLTTIDFSLCNSLQTIGSQAFILCPINSITTPGSYTSGQKTWNWGDNTQGGNAFTTRACWENGQIVGETIEAINSEFIPLAGLAYGELNLSDSALTEIANSTFQYSYGITSVVFPETLKTIGENAFRDCINISETNLSNCQLLESINGSAFASCTELSSVVFPNNLITIGQDSFLDCSSLTSVSFPNSLTTIGEDAFGYCPLTSITTPNQTNTGSKITTWTWGSGETKFTTRAFWDDNNNIVGQMIEQDTNYSTVGCLGYGHIDLSNTELTQTPEYAFDKCDGLTELICPDTLLEISDMSFRSCHNLNTVEFSKNLQKIGEDAFEDCTSLTSVDLSQCSNLINIDLGAFTQCTKISDITFPATFFTVDQDSFAMGDSEISDLTSIYLYWDMPASLQLFTSNWISGTFANARTFYVSSDSLDAYNAYVADSTTCPSWWQDDMSFAGFTPSPTPGPTPTPSDNNDNTALVIGLGAGLGGLSLILMISTITLGVKLHKNSPKKNKK